MIMMEYTGYGKNNAFLNELEELKQQAEFRSNDLMKDDLTRAKAEATAAAYAFCQHRLMTIYNDC